MWIPFVVVIQQPVWTIVGGTRHPRFANIAADSCCCSLKSKFDFDEQGSLVFVGPTLAGWRHYTEVRSFPVWYHCNAGGGRGESRRNSSNALTRSATLLDLGSYLPAHICLAFDIAWEFEIGFSAKIRLAKLQLEIVQPTGFSSRKVFYWLHSRFPNIRLGKCRKQKSKVLKVHNGLVMMMLLLMLMLLMVTMMRSSFTIQDKVHARLPVFTTTSAIGAQLWFLLQMIYFCTFYICTCDPIDTFNTSYIFYHWYFDLSMICQWSTWSQCH